MENIQRYQYSAETESLGKEGKKERDVGGHFWHISASAGKAADMTGWLEMHGVHA